MTPIYSPGVINAPGDYYLANDIVVTSPAQLSNSAALLITAAGVRLNTNGFKVRGVGLSPNSPSYGIRGQATNNLVVCDGQVGGVTGFWCGIQSETPWTRLEQLVLSGNYNIGANLTAHTPRIYYNVIDGIGGETLDPYNTCLLLANPSYGSGGGRYEVRGNIIRNMYKQGSGVGEGVAIILSATSCGGVCERNFIENDVEEAGTIGIFGGMGGTHTLTGNVLTGFKFPIQAGGTPGSAITARLNTIRLRSSMAGSVGISADYGLVEDNLIAGYATPFSGGASTGNGNTFY